jgi:hypothetical protein
MNNLFIIIILQSILPTLFPYILFFTLFGLPQNWLIIQIIAI